VIDVLRSEWIKFRSVRSNLVLIGSAGALVILVAVLVAHQKNKNGFGSDAHLGDVTGGIPFALFLFGALGVQIIGQEYRFNTIRPTFTAVPQRMRVLVAKLIVVTTTCALVSVVMLAACALVGSLMLDRFTIDSLDHRVMWGTLLFVVAWTALGMGVGAILRQPIAGMLVLLIEAFVVENILVSVVKSTGPWLPFLNGIQMTLRDNPDDRLRTVLGGGIYFVLFAAVVWAIGAVLAVRRDA
jgi:ABC-2 type transport system permease protein